MGGPTGNYVTTSIALKIIGTLRPPHLAKDAFSKVETPSRRILLNIIFLISQLMNTC
jgi:hypothetical protein